MGRGHCRQLCCSLQFQQLEAEHSSLVWGEGQEQEAMAGQEDHG